MVGPDDLKRKGRLVLYDRRETRHLKYLGREMHHAAYCAELAVS